MASRAILYRALHVAGLRLTGVVQQMIHILSSAGLRRPAGWIQQYSGYFQLSNT